MVGLPEETLDDIRDSFELAVELKPTFLHWHVFCPLPGSSLHDQLAFEDQIDFDEIRYDRASRSTSYLSASEVNSIFNRICKYFYENGKHPF